MTFEERIEAITQTLELSTRMQVDAAERHDRQIAEHDRQIAEHDREIARIDREIQRTNHILRRAIRLGVREARNERKRRQELDQHVKEQAAEADRRHRELEELLRRFLERGGNGQH
jgi:hypothetical protein